MLSFTSVITKACDTHNTMLNCGNKCQDFASQKLTHWTRIHSKIASINKNPLYVCGETVHTFCSHQNCVCTRNHVCAKNHLHIQFTQLLSFQVYSNNGEALIDLVYSTLLYGTSRMPCTKIVTIRMLKGRKSWKFYTSTRKIL